MKKTLLLLTVALICLAGAGCGREEVKPEGGDRSAAVPDAPSEPDGILHSRFSVAEGRQVRFSRGNLQFCSTGSHATVEGTAMGVFRFAEHQYDYVGQANALVSDTNTGWIDLFCWGSSGWHVAPCSEKDGDYDIESLCGSESYADWGVYNAIGSGVPGTWRTLTRDEWDYLVNRRAASSVDGIDSARYAEATVCGVKGLILLPDQFERPASLAPIANINPDDLAFDFGDNVYDTETWKLMEDAGAVFLPAAGFRGGTWISTVGEGGNYWAATCNANRQAYALLFINGLVNASAECHYEKDRGYGRSVRLVADVQNQR